jgi:hypothetical protein
MQLVFFANTLANKGTKLSMEIGKMETWNYAPASHIYLND